MTERNPREGIREELRQKIMEQLQECSRMEDDESYEQIDRASTGKKGQELISAYLKSGCGSGAVLYDSLSPSGHLTGAVDDRNVTEISR